VVLLYFYCCVSTATVTELLQQKYICRKQKVEIGGGQTDRQTDM
jgi:hypothetical protein